MSLEGGTVSRLAESFPNTAEKSRPRDIALRCMAYPDGDGSYVAECIDLDLIVASKTPRRHKTA